MGFFSKIKKGFKKVLPYAATAAGAAFGGPIGGAIGGSLFGKTGEKYGSMLGGALGNMAGDGFSSAQQLAATQYGYDQSLKGIREQNWSARQIASDANKLSQQQANQQMLFQAGMSNTAHQREIKDLRRAGLNPILSGGGMGASTPQGAAGDVSVAPVRSEGDAISTAMDVFRTVAQAMKTNADREFVQSVATPKAQAETAKTKSETMPRIENIAKLKTQINAIATENYKNQMDADLKEQLRIESRKVVENLEKTGKNLDVTQRQMKAELQRMLADEEIYNGEAGYWIRLIEKLAPAAGKIPNVVLKKGR